MRTVTSLMSWRAIIILTGHRTCNLAMERLNSKKLPWVDPPPVPCGVGWGGWVGRAGGRARGGCLQVQKQVQLPAPKVTDHQL